MPGLCHIITLLLFLAGCLGLGLPGVARAQHAETSGGCALAVIVLPEHTLSLPVGATSLRRDTLVLRTHNRCENGELVRTLSLPDVYAGAIEATPVGETVCVPDAVLASPTPFSFIAQGWGPAAPSQTPGQVWGGPPAALACDAAVVRFGQDYLPIDKLTNLRPITSDTLARVRWVAEEASKRFGPVSIASIGFTHTGRVSLPWTHWVTPEERAETLAREALDTPARAERAITAHGPFHVYQRFDGADPPRADVWGTPDAVVALLHLLADWRDECARLPGTTPEQCVVQLGDMSWYTSLRPDPLGHKDHYLGNCVDVRLFRSDASRYEAWWNRADDRPSFAASDGYSRTITAAFVAFARTRPEVPQVLFNDPHVPGATSARGHDDHLHLCFVTP